VTSARISVRISPETKAAATRVAAANGLTLAGMVREFLYRYLLTEAPPVRELPPTRGAQITTLYVGAKLARAARLRAQRNGEDLTRPIVEFLTRTVEQAQQETPTKPTTPTENP
jgi:antitoxin component of RelBE/YafQ-DinJ toxin-antitoxin module